MLASRPPTATFRLSAVLDMTASLAATTKHQPRSTSPAPLRPAPPPRAAGPARSLRLVAQQEGLLQEEPAPVMAASLLTPLLFLAIARQSAPDLIGNSIDPALHVRRFLRGRLVEPTSAQKHASA